MKISVIGIGSLLALSRVSLAQVIAAPCAEDQIVSYQAVQGRNDWAVKCGYLDPEFGDMLNTQGVYIIFNDRIAPIDSAAECSVGEIVGRYCKVSCSSEQEKVLFTDGYRTLVDSADRDDHTPLRVAYHIREDPFLISWGEEEIEMFIAGDYEGFMYRIVLEDTKSLSVTRTHAMVLADATVLAAEDLSVDHWLMTVDGPVKIRSIEQVRYVGKVWHVQPFSVEKNRNVIVVEGILTGSARFQNEWADKSNRLSLRNKILVTEGQCEMKNFIF